MSSGSSLEFIGIGAFRDSGLREFRAPASLATVSQCAFYGCRDLKSVVLNEGLQNLGLNRLSKAGERFFGVFENSGLEEI